VCFQRFLDHLAQQCTDTGALSEVVAILQTFLMPPCLVIAKGDTFKKIWEPAQGWQPVESNRQE
jgi:hypothetical protein